MRAEIMPTYRYTLQLAKNHRIYAYRYFHTNHACLKCSYTYVAVRVCMLYVYCFIRSYRRFEHNCDVILTVLRINQQTYTHVQHNLYCFDRLSNSDKGVAYIASYTKLKPIRPISYAAPTEGRQLIQQLPLLSQSRELPL